MRVNCPRYNESTRSPVALAREPGKVSRDSSQKLVLPICLGALIMHFNDQGKF